MSRIRKIADLPEGTIKQREAPMVLRASFDSPCHIVVANAHVSRGDRFQHTDSYVITRCNRLIQGWLTVDSIGDLSICPRCGTPDDFKSAIEQHRKAMDKFLAESNARHEAQQAESDRVLKDNQDTTIAILREHGLNAHRDPAGRKVVFEFGGHTFAVEMKEVSQ